MLVYTCLTGYYFTIKSMFFFNISITSTNIPIWEYIIHRNTHAHTHTHMPVWKCKSCMQIYMCTHTDQYGIHVIYMTHTWVHIHTCASIVSSVPHTCTQTYVGREYHVQDMFKTFQKLSLPLDLRPNQDCATFVKDIQHLVSSLPILYFLQKEGFKRLPLKFFQWSRNVTLDTSGQIFRSHISILLQSQNKLEINLYSLHCVGTPILSWVTVNQDQQDCPPTVHRVSVPGVRTYHPSHDCRPQGRSTNQWRSPVPEQIYKEHREMTEENYFKKEEGRGGSEGEKEESVHRPSLEKFVLKEYQENKQNCARLTGKAP